MTQDDTVYIDIIPFGEPLFPEWCETCLLPCAVIQPFKVVTGMRVMASGNARWCEKCGDGL